MKKLERQRREHPVLFAFAEGFAACLSLAFATGLAQGAAATPALSVLAWSAMAFKRPAAYQATLAVTFALFVDLLSSNPAGESIIPLMAAMIAGNMWASPTDRRWEPGHALFTFVALGGWTLASGILGLVNPGFFGHAPRVGTVFSSLLVLALASAGIWGWLVWRDSKSRRRPRLSGSAKIGG